MNMDEWTTHCAHNVTAGYTPGGKAANIPVSGKAIADYLLKQGILYLGAPNQVGIWATI